jgi:hypothetical protein
METRGRAGNGSMETRALLSRRDWVYLLGLLVPFVVYDLVLKAILVFSQSESPGFLGGFGLMRSDLLFNVGYALFWMGVFAVARRGAYRWVAVVLFHLVTISVALLSRGNGRRGSERAHPGHRAPAPVYNLLCDTRSLAGNPPRWPATWFAPQHPAGKYLLAPHVRRGPRSVRDVLVLPDPRR